MLTALGRTSAPETGDPWPRVWWCPTGPLTVLPIHAAGHHPRLRTADTGDTDCVLDRVISSYTPTLTALTASGSPSDAVPVTATDRRHARHPRSAAAARGPSRARSPRTPLPAWRDQPPALPGHRQPAAAVLAAIATHSWVHLACHASQQHADPDRSGFALWDGTLTITDLAAQPTQQP